MMNPDELRSGFLKFFTDRGHTLCKSDLLIPTGDPTLLFTSAGMNQFKEMFLGQGTLSFNRATSSQKCMRMPDLENVGRTPSHHTFFEMLGNFSFGDYFKREAIAWSIEYLVNTLGLDFKDLSVSIYEDDDESAAIWEKEQGVPRERMYRFGEKDNFWPAEAPSKGPNGVCGPCSEIYVDMKGGCGRSTCSPECDCGRFVEVWNLVFTQFIRKDGGVLEPLPFKNIDTGMGFERLLRVLDGVNTNFDTALFIPIIEALCGLCGRAYGQEKMDDIRMRRITDHVRAAVFGIVDGATPSNEKQGYVIRKVLRRAIMDGRNLGIKDSFLQTLVKPVADCMGRAYPELLEQQSRIERLIRQEEEKFAETYLQGSARLSVLIEDMGQKGRNVLDGRSAFLLYDTFGFPLDLAKRTLNEHGFTVDTEGYNAEMEAQRERARKGSKISENVFDTGPLGTIKSATPPTRFVGYDKLNIACRVLHILTEEGLVDGVGEGQCASLLLDETPFYAESGGQVGDVGTIRSDHFTFTVDRGTYLDGEFYVHTGIVTEGSVSKGAVGEARVEKRKRRSTQRNHTATHLLHFALRKVLGPHVEQAGSLVKPSRLRFDFSHNAALKPEELHRIQTEVNEKIRSNLLVTHEIQTLDEAKKAGAMALFGEKYTDRVRVVSIRDRGSGESSLELCGGTHVGATGEIGGFRILSEESIAAGTRRIEAATGEGLEAILDHQLSILKGAGEALKSVEGDLIKSILLLQEQLRDHRRELKKYRTAEAEETANAILKRGELLPGDLRFFWGRIANMPVEEVRKMSDSIRARSDLPAGLVLVSVEGSKVHIVAAFDEAFQKKGIRAGDVCRLLGKELGGGGGGKPGMAQGQGKKPDQADKALERAVSDILKRLKD